MEEDAWKVMSSYPGRTASRQDCEVSPIQKTSAPSEQGREGAKDLGNRRIRKSCSMKVDFLGVKAIFASPLLCVALGFGIISTAKSLNNVRIIADEEHSNTA